MNAERVFFVEDNPVIVFTEIPGKDPAEDLVEAYRRAWSMARPRCLFIATDDEIRVYSLSSPPVSSADKFNELTPLQIVTRTADVAEQLADFRRDKIEDGSLFERAGFAAGSKRADTQFLEDVERATEMLESQGMSQHLAHGLIERVVLIRYLEDRAVLTPEYYERIAARRQSWLRAIRSQRVGALGSRSLFLECLEDTDLTREIFRDLARTFNGDLFVPLPEEESISSEHLLAIQRLFNGEGFTETRQEPLFLWAYDFSVVPTSLISSMYEQFYHADSSDDSRSYKEERGPPLEPVRGYRRR